MLKSCSNMGSFFLFALGFLGVCPALAQTPAPPAPANVLPQEWVGTWEGKCVNRGTRGESAPWHMKLDTHKQAEENKWNWHITYGEGEQSQLRAYDLVAVPGKVGQFVVDEHEGVEIHQSLVFGGRVMYSLFDVGSPSEPNSSARNTSRFEISGPKMTVEISAFAYTPKTHYGDDTFAINSYGMWSLQMCTLFRTAR